MGWPGCVESAPALTAAVLHPRRHLRVSASVIRASALPMVPAAFVSWIGPRPTGADPATAWVHAVHSWDIKDHLWLRLFIARSHH